MGQYIKKEDFSVKIENFEVEVSKRKKKKSVYIQMVDSLEIGRFGIKHEYDEELLNKYRSMETTHRARWDSEDRMWTFPDKHAEHVVNILLEFEFVIVKDKRSKDSSFEVKLRKKQFKKQAKKERKKQDKLERILSKGGALDKSKQAGTQRLQKQREQQLQQQIQQQLQQQMQQETVLVEVVDVMEVGRFGVRNRYNTELLQSYRRMMQTHQARWEADEKMWTFPEKLQDSVISVLSKIDNVVVKYRRFSRPIQNRRQPFSAEATSPYILRSWHISR